MKKIILSIALSLSTFSLLAQLDSAAFEVRNGGPTTKSFVSVPTPALSNLRLTSSYTAEALVFIPIGATASDFFIVETYSAGATGGFVLRVTNGYVKGYQLESQSNLISLTGNTQMTPGQWNHVAVTLDQVNSTLNVFLNGSLDGSIPCGIPSSNTNSFLNIGARGDDNAVSTIINIDEVRIWNYARSASEIAAQATMCISGTENGLLAYYDFEGSTIATVEDKTGNGNDGTIENFTSLSYVPGPFKCESSLQLNELNTVSITLYPNPAIDKLTVSSESAISEITVMDATGKIVKTTTETSFSVADLTSGIYFLTISTDQGIAQNKFIKE